MDVNELIAERDQLQVDLQDGSLDDATLDAKIKRANEVNATIKAHNERVTKANEARAALASAKPGSIVMPTSTPEADDNRGVFKSQSDVISRIHKDREFQRFIAGGGHGNASVKLDSAETRALFGATLGHRSGSGDVGAVTTIVQPTPTPGILQPLLRPLRVADLFDRQSTTAGAMTYVKDITAHPEGSASAVSPGAQKPESSYAFEIVSIAFSKIAHILAVPMEAIEDNTQLEGYLSGQMVYGLDFAVDFALLNGSGVAPALEGIIAAGTPDTDPHDEDIVVSIRKAKTKAMLANVNGADLAVVLNPADWEAVELLRANQGGGAGTGAFMSLTSDYAGVVPKIWGMPVVEFNACPQGTGIVGAFRVGATIWDRMEATVAISDSNQDYFEKNILTLRAELRLALAIYRPNAFQVVTFDAP